MNNNTFRNNSDNSDDNLINFPNRIDRSLQEKDEVDSEIDETDDLEENSFEGASEEVSDGSSSGVTTGNDSFGRQAFLNQNGDKNYYADKKREQQENVDTAQRKKDAAETESKRDYKKKDPNDTGAWKADGSDTKKKEKEDIKSDKKELKAANRELKDSKRELRNTKLNSLSSKAYQAKHPIEATKEKVKNKILMAILKHPTVLVVLGIVLVIFILIFLVAVLLKKNAFDVNMGSGATASTCDYNINGINAQTKVELINCSAKKDDYQVLDTMTLEKYVAGVAIAEMGQNYADEAMKAQLVAVRSYTLTRNIPEYGVGYDSSANVIRMRACENDQVYWDYSKDIYRGTGPNSNVATYSPEYQPREGEIPWKKALSEDEKSKYETIVSSVLGKYVIDSSGKVVQTGYINTTTDKFVELAKTNEGTENGKYPAILMAVYNNVSSVSTANCEMLYFGTAGEYSNWKQKTSLGAPWGNVSLGCGATINSVGCLITSIAMQIAYSGVPTGSIVDFNPGTFAQAMQAAKYIDCGGNLNSYAGISKLIPDFQFVGRIYLSGDDEKRNQTIKEYAAQGYYIVIEVRKAYGGQHWVALDVKNSAVADWKKIYIWDPASATRNTIDSKHQYKAGQFVYFKTSGVGGSV